MRINVSVDMRGFDAKVAMLKEQAPFAVALALTKTGQAVNNALRMGMSESFRNVTAYTRNSLSLSPATKAKLLAVVSVKGGEAGVIKSLRPEIFGGQRQKAIEKVLAKAGLPPNGMYAAPGRYAKKKGNNVDIEWLATLIAGILVQGQTGTTMMTGGRRRNAKRGGAANYFVLKEPWGKLTAGIYGKKGPHIFQYVMFIRQPAYKKRFDYFGIAEKAARAAFPKEFDAAAKRALATRR